ncbi:MULTISPECIES: DUF427 domain-containing protein [Subtercola]|uniref:DUF427 domain-containing protein n=1 Tax=Subtercola vilae TaxID=2056433 RepID=A0A4T2C2T7_9MICO|nr:MULTISPECIES: DUF427 domain-containing protein [Subtercola]MEA9986532.1 DUF427 domain-containing protein [Subtercola sp. RTI3]TIH38290.1 DUF427 domain-containing protein [Subtercola vilae]
MKRTQITREVPGPGQESVWEYPRPPRAEPSAERIVIVLGGESIVDTTDSVRILETSHPPVYYLPVAAFRPGALSDAPGQSFCEFKGLAGYLSVHGGSQTAASAAWYYPDPSPGYEVLAGRVAVYPSAMQQCTVDGEVVTSQEGDFYGGWITSRVVGPFKGAPGTLGW